MRPNPLKRSRRRREAGDATVVAYVGWRKVAGRDAYRIWDPAAAADAAPALAAHQATLGCGECSAKPYPELRRRVRKLVDTGLAHPVSKLSFTTEGGVP